MPKELFHIPPRRKHFIGRGAELQLIDAYFEEYPVVTVLGAGGMGKTRLAMQYGVETQRFDRVIFCDVTDARDEESLQESVARQWPTGLAPPQPSSLEHLGTTAHELAGALLIFDNLEQCVEAAAALVSRWLREAPGLRVLGTSRAPLRIRGERQMRLQPLSLARARELFEHRARQARADFCVDPRNERDVHAVIEHLDGVPLAVELAAARINMMSPGQLLAQLERPGASLDTLARKTRLATVRHQTIRASLEWSWDLLTPAERDVLAGASVFRGGFDLEAAEAVLADDQTTWIGELLEELVDKSVLLTRQIDTAAGRQRRFWLMTTTANFAADKLDARRRQRLSQAHAKHYLTRLEADREDPPRHEAANAVAAFWRLLKQEPALAARAALVAVRLSRALAEPLDILDAALATSPTDERIRARLLSAKASCHGARGEHMAALDHASSALEDAARAGSENTRAFLHYRRSKAMVGLGRHAQARGELREALTVAKRRRDTRAEAIFRSALGDVDFALGRFEEADAAWHRALQTTRRTQHRTLSVHLLAKIARSAMLHGELDVAHRRLEEARAVNSGHVAEAQGVILEVAAELAWLSGDLDAAKRDLDAALDIASASADYQAPIAARFGLATIAANEALDEAAHHLDAIIELVWDNDDIYNRVQAYTRMAVLRLRQQNLREAQHLLERAVDEASRLDDARAQPHTKAWLGLTYAANSHPTRAARLLDEARLALREDGFDNLAAQVDDFEAVADAICGGAHLQRPRLIATAQAHRFKPHSRIAAWRFYEPLSLLADLLDAQGAEHGAVFTVARDGSAFTLPGSDLVDLSTRGSLRLILAELSTMRQANPGAGLSVDELRHVGWPDDVLTDEAGSARVYTAIRNLRSMGLDDILLTGRNGYYLDPEIPFAWAK